MDTLETYRQLIEDILIGHTQIPYAYGDIKFETVCAPLRGSAKQIANKIVMC